MNISSQARRAVLVGVLGFTAVVGVEANTGVEPQVQNQIPYVSDGIGQSRHEALAAVAGQGYTLHLVFAERGTGDYLADVHVVVADKAGHPVLQVLSPGPLFFAKLPPGDYRVSAEINGSRQTRTVHIGKGMATAAMYWPAGSMASASGAH